MSVLVIQECPAWFLDVFIVERKYDSFNRSSVFVDALLTILIKTSNFRASKKSKDH